MKKTKRKSSKRAAPHAVSLTLHVPKEMLGFYIDVGEMAEVSLQDVLSVVLAMRAVKDVGVSKND